MVFSSVVFLVYFLPLLLLAYRICPVAMRNWLLLLASIVFYSWGAPKFIFVILGTTLLDFYLVSAMNRSEQRIKRRLLLTFSVCLNVGLLFYFKYCDFFFSNLNVLLTGMGVGEIKLLKVLLPIGISFYTFESLTYVVDVYRRVHAPLKNFWHYQLYIILFPKLIAGPIIRYHEIADQIPLPRALDNDDGRIKGFVRFCIGLGKKIFIANSVGLIADDVFGSDPAYMGTADAWLGMLAYTFQIYFDFSGYSDMAIGLGRMFGFVFPENFDNPYTSGSITEFWRKWHMTLGSWMRNYLYIPLGGNRVKNPARLYFNLWLVFLASGLWHGAAWTFIFWGAYHGFLLVIERLFLLGIYKRLGRLVSIPITFLLVAIGWVLFRADTAEQAWQIIRLLFSQSDSLLGIRYDLRFYFFMIVAAAFSFFVLLPKGANFQESIFHGIYSNRIAILLTVLACIVFTIALAMVAASDFNPFIYFRF